MAGAQGESDDDIEVLDLTTPVPPPISRLAPTRATATTAASSSPPGSPSLAHSSSHADEQGASDDQSVCEVDNDDLFGGDEWKPLRERLKPAVVVGSAVSGSGSSATMAASVPAAATAAAATSDGGGGDSAAAAATAAAAGRRRKEKCKSKLRQAAGGGGDMCWQEEEGDEDEDEDEECVMNTQEGEVVDLLSDSDDADEVAPGRSQLWNRGGRGGGRVGGGGSDRGEEEEPEVLEGSADTLGLDEFDSLLLASQTSSKESPARSSRVARRARDGVNRGDALGAGGRGSGSGATVPGACALDVDDSEDEFSLDPVWASSKGRVLPSSGGDGGCGGGGGDDDAGAVSTVVVSKQQKALERKEATATKKRQRQKAAAAAKHQRERERLERKHEKERAKQAEKVEKAAKKEKEQQARGNFSHMEVTCVMERRYFDSSRSACVRAGVSEQPGRPEKFKVAAGDCGTVGAVWWTRRAYLDGGAATTGPGVKTLDILIVVVDPTTFFDKLGHSGAGGGSGESVGGDREGGGSGGGGGGAFPGLSRFVDDIRASASEFSRLVLVLEGVEEESHRRRSRRPASGSTGVAAWSIMDDFEDALCWLLIHKDVETRPTKDSEETGQYLWDLTKCLSTMPYKDDVTELHCVNRSNAEAKGSSLLPKEEKELADTWVRMLVQVLGISENIAQGIAQIYPLPRDLAAAFLDPNVPEAQRATLLADKMGPKTQGKLARRVFDLFTHEDGDFVLP